MRGTSLRVGNTTIRIEDGEDAIVPLHPQDRYGGLRGKSVAMRRLMARLEKAGQSDAPVLITGESGTGKELVARALHEQGKRRDGPFVTVDCAALSPNLISSELFGHERGAFTGAEALQLGAFERACGGTLFLDEVGELPAEQQTFFLGALERRSFVRVGGSKNIETDVRVVSASNRDLRAEVNSGRFRLDLFYRLAIGRFQVPPLREHAEDIPLLVEHFLRELGSEQSVHEVVPEQAM